MPEMSCLPDATITGGHYSTKMDYMKAFSNHYQAASESNLFFFLVDFLFVIRIASCFAAIPKLATSIYNLEFYLIK